MFSGWLNGILQRTAQIRSPRSSRARLSDHLQAIDGIGGGV